MTSHPTPLALSFRAAAVAAAQHPADLGRVDELSGAEDLWRRFHELDVRIARLEIAERERRAGERAARRKRAA